MVTNSEFSDHSGSPAFCVTNGGKANIVGSRFTGNQGNSTDNGALAVNSSYTFELSVVLLVANCLKGCRYFCRERNSCCWRFESQEQPSGIAWWPRNLLRQQVCDF